MSDINKDIEIVETRIEYYKNNPEGCNWKLSFEDAEEIQALENLISFAENEALFIITYDKQFQELKTYKKENEDLIRALKQIYANLEILDISGSKEIIEEILNEKR